MNYKELLEKTEKELNTLRTQEAVYNEKINNLVDQLGLDKEGNLSEQVDNLLVALDEKTKKLEGTIDELLHKLDSLYVNVEG